MRILVVEDEPILAITAAAVLEGKGHDVVGPAYDTAEALALAACERLDLAFVDINLDTTKVFSWPGTCARGSGWLRCSSAVKHRRHGPTATPRSAS